MIGTQRKAAKQSDLLDHEAERAALQAILEHRYLAMLRAVHALIGDLLPVDEFQGGFRVDDPATRRFIEKAQLAVVEIDDTTREAIRKTITEGQARGYSDWEIANGVPTDDYAGLEGLFKTTWAGRPELIARTEMTRAQVAASLDRYRASGLVDHVKIADGTQHAVCAARNGKIVPVTDNVTILHPRCRVQVIPIVREGVV